MKKLLFVLPEYPSIGGIESVTAIIAPKLTAVGWKCDYLAPFRGRNIASHKAPSNTEVFYFPDERHYDSRLNREYTVRILEDKRYDCIIYQDSYSPMERVIIEAAKTTKMPVVVFEHSSPLFVRKKRTLEPFYSKMGFLRRVFHPMLVYKDKRRRRYLFDNCKRYVLLSSSFTDDFTQASGITDFQGKLDIIPNPLTLNAKHVSYSSKENRILFVGRLVKEKNVRLIIDIWHHLSSLFPDWELSIVGDGEERRKLENEVRKKNIPGVIFEGYQNPEQYYDKAKFILLTSKFEGWGLTLTEAMGRGCIPVALNSYSSLSDIISNGEDGVIMETAAPRAWAEKISSLINTTGRPEKMSENAFRKACCFEIDNIIPEWHKLLKNAIEKR